MSAGPTPRPSAQAHPAPNPLALTTWARELGMAVGEVRSTERLGGGQSNPTWRLRADGGDFVLRMRPAPAARLARNAHAIDREFRVLSALHDSAVPVPEPIAFCHDESWVGREFYLMRAVEGRVFWDSTFPELPDATARANAHAAMVATLVAIHTIRWQNVGLADFGRPERWLAHQTDAWIRRYQEQQTELISEMDAIAAWLPRNVPHVSQAALVHGDFRVDNMILSPDGGTVRAVIDWELATIGDPVLDLAHFAIAWVTPGSVWRGMAQADLLSLGVPPLEATVDHWFEATGFAGREAWKFYLVLALFRFATILQGIVRQAADGIASSDDPRPAIRSRRALARIACDVAESC